MSNAKTIVFPTDFSELSNKSLPWAKRLAAVLDAELHCIYVVEEPAVYASIDMSASMMPDVAELQRQAGARLEKFAAEHFGSGDEHVISQVIVGRAADEIVNYADEHDAELTIMSTHGYSGLKHIVMGSTTEAVLRQANCPVLAVPAND